MGHILKNFNKAERYSSQKQYPVFLIISPDSRHRDLICASQYYRL